MYIVEGTRSEIREKIEEQLSHIVRWKKLIVPKINFYIARVAEIEKEHFYIIFRDFSKLSDESRTWRRSVADRTRLK